MAIAVAAAATATALAGAVVHRNDGGGLREHPDGRFRLDPFYSPPRFGAPRPGRVAAVVLHCVATTPLFVIVVAVVVLVLQLMLRFLLLPAAAAAPTAADQSQTGMSPLEGPSLYSLLFVPAAATCPGWTTTDTGSYRIGTRVAEIGSCRRPFFVVLQMQERRRPLPRSERRRRVSGLKPVHRSRCRCC